MQRERAPSNTRVCTRGARLGPLDLKGAPSHASLIPHLLPAADADDDEQPLPASSSAPADPCTYPGGSCLTSTAKAVRGGGFSEGVNI